MKKLSEQKQKNYMDYMMEQLQNLLAIDSPSGFTDKVTDYLLEEYKRLGGSFDVL